MEQAPSPVPQPTSQGSSTLSFTQGFLLGQLSIALILFFCVKFFIFGELPSADDRALHLSSLRRARTLAHQSSTLHLRTRSNSTSHPLRPKSSRTVIREAANAAGPTVGAILAKTYYNVKGHQPESLDWFNVLIAQTIAQLRADARQDGAILTSLTEVLNTGTKPSFLGEIKVTEIALGDEFPIFSNCRVMPAEEGFLSTGVSGGMAPVEEGRLQARMDVDLSDIITLGIETTLMLNWPTERVAILPVALAVSVVRFSGTLAVSFIPSASPIDEEAVQDERPSPAGGERSTPRRPTTLAFTFLDDYRLDLSVRSLVGSRSRLQDVPKIAQLIESRVHAWFDERAVEPRFQQIVLPSLWPRKKTTRGGEEDDVAVGEDDEGIDVTSPPDTLPGIPARERAAQLESLEARIEAEGAKLREAEIRAGERSRRAGSPEGVRYRGEGLRGHTRPTGRLNREWSAREMGDRMPGSMPNDQFS